MPVPQCPHWSRVTVRALVQTGHLPGSGFIFITSNSIFSMFVAIFFIWGNNSTASGACQGVICTKLKGSLKISILKLILFGKEALV
jgi:hypothetical protein